MQKKLLGVILLSVVLASTAFASTVNVPFIRQPVPAEGLTIHYNTDHSAQKVACLLENFYKGYIYYTENNVLKDSGIAFGDGQETDQFYFTARGQTQTNMEVDQFHVDPAGSIVAKNVGKPNTAFATCFYLNEAAK